MFVLIGQEEQAVGTAVINFQSLPVSEEQCWIGQ